MNRTDRLFALVLELQSRKTTRSEDLATTFGTSRRTIYRDIQALSQSGVPVVSLPGQGYSIVEGYFLPPLSFTSEEATMLLLGADFVAQNFDSQYRASAQSAMAKIKAALSDPLREEVAEMQRGIRFIAGDYEINHSKNEILALLRRAVITRRRARFLYHTRFPERGRNAKNLREVDPYGLAHAYGVWYLVAHCHLRRDTRVFRLDRISQLEILDEAFERPKDFRMQSHREDEDRPMVVRALFDKEVAPWVRESPSYYVTEMEEARGGLMVTLKARREDDVLHWLMSWGSHVRVVEPESLWRLMAEEAEKIIRNHRGRC
jgi:predicted DNA-binding transcriptional regulator YafY